MKEYNVSLVVEVPEVGASERQIDEWLQYRLGYSNDMSASNPLEDAEVVANWFESEPR